MERDLTRRGQAGRASAEIARGISLRLGRGRSQKCAFHGDLGVIRTREMMNAARVEGTELHFLNMPEFGFSKSPEETFEKWGHDETLKRMM